MGLFVQNCSTGNVILSDEERTPLPACHGGGLPSSPRHRAKSRRAALGAPVRRTRARLALVSNNGGTYRTTLATDYLRLSPFSQQLAAL